MPVMIPNLTQAHDPVMALAKTYQQAKHPFTLAIIAAVPDQHWRLQAAGLLTEATWSVFDAMLDLPQTCDGVPQELATLDVPADALPLVAWPTTSYYVAGVRTLCVHLHARGCVWQVEWFTPQGRHVDQYDDRGWHLWTTWYDQADQLVRRVYYNAQEQAVMAQTPNGVHIAQAAQGRFKAQAYPNMAAIVQEYLTRWLNPASSMVISADQVVGKMLAKRLHTVYLVGEADGWNPDFADGDAHLVFMTAADQVRYLQQWVPLRSSQQLQAQAQVLLPAAISLALGTSNEQDHELIVWEVGDAPFEPQALLRQLLVKLASHASARLCVLAVDQAQAKVMQNLVNAWTLKEAGLTMTDWPELAAAQTALSHQQPLRHAKSEDAAHDGQLQAALLNLQRVDVTEYADATLQAAMATARVYIGTATKPQLFSQLAAVAAGVPQVVLKANELVSAQVNGMICTDPLAIADAAWAYIVDLRRFNQAVVANVALAEHYQAQTLVARWEAQLS